jgi:hypothetical protein
MQLNRRLSGLLATLLSLAAAVPRLGIRKFNWWSEALHGNSSADKDLKTIKMTII